MTFKLLLFFNIILINIGCSQYQKNNIQNKYFSKEEIQDLNTILTFFENEICSNAGLLDRKDIKKCYSSFFSLVEKNIQNGLLDTNLTDKKIDAIINKINRSSVDAIWYYNKAYTVTDTFKIIKINTKGKYMSYLKDLGIEYPLVKDYYEKVYFSGDISPSLIVGIVNNQENLNLEDVNIKNFLAIHYITIGYGNHGR